MGPRWRPAAASEEPRSEGEVTVLLCLRGLGVTFLRPICLVTCLTALLGSGYVSPWLGVWSAMCLCRDRRLSQIQLVGLLCTPRAGSAAAVSCGGASRPGAVPGPPAGPGHARALCESVPWAAAQRLPVQRAHSLVSHPLPPPDPLREACCGQPASALLGGARSAHLCELGFWVCFGLERNGVCSAST